MTVAAELALGAARLEYFVTIEGIGWPYSGYISDLSSGFAGVIFATADQDGDLATQLSGTETPTIYPGLALPRGISDSIDPRAGEFKLSGASLTITDHNDWWSTNCTPRKQGTTTDLSLGIGFIDRTIRLDDGTTFDEDDLVWIGGRELVKLGTKALVGGTVYDYSLCVRGYLGTQKGSSLRRPDDFCLTYWPGGTSVQTIPWWWWNRKVAIWAHVPGEAAANAQLMWYGKIRSVQNPSAGIDWKLECVSDFISAANRIRRAVDWRVTSHHLEGSASDSRHYEDKATVKSASFGKQRRLDFGIPSAPKYGTGSWEYELANAYNWRAEAGGLEGMVSTWDGGGVQAVDIGTETDCLYSFVWINGSAYKMTRKEDHDSNTDPKLVLGEIISRAGDSPISNAPVSPNGHFIGDIDLTLESSSPARFMLDNMGKDKWRNRFVVDGVIRRHPIDVGLIFMLSYDREIWRGDTIAGSASSSWIHFAANSFDSVGLTNNHALFCMEGNYRWESREITGNDNYRITLERGFSGIPPGGIEMQIRNSIYDVLPFGWGMGIDVHDVDVDAFETIRDNDIPEAIVGEFMLGAQDEIDLWQIVNDYCFKPYGVVPYFDLNTRKISAKYMRVTPEDGILEDYVAINRQHIRSPGRIQHQLNPPIGSINLKVRAIEDRIVGVTRSLTSKVVRGTTALLPTPSIDRVPALLDGATKNIIIRSEEVNLAFAEHEMDQLEINALLNTEGEDAEELARRMLGMVSEYSVPPPVWNPQLDTELYLDLEPGAYVVINWYAESAPANPLTGVRGWSDVIGRVIKRTQPSKGSTQFDCSIELLVANTIGRLAPAAIVTAKGSDGFGAYFTCDTTELFVADPDNDKDWWYFAVGDVLEHRDTNGAIKGGWANRAITAFGTNQVSDPTSATGTRVYVDGAIGSAVAAGDYITFADWSNATTRMKKYSAYANSSGLLNGVDTARKYGG